MMSKRLTFWSTILTGLGLMLIGLVYLFGMVVALNGVRENQALLAMAIWLFGHLTILALACVIARWSSRALASKAQWKSWLALAVSVLGAVSVGALLSFLAVIVSILLAGIR